MKNGRTSTNYLALWLGTNLRIHVCRCFLEVDSLDTEGSGPTAIGWQSTNNSATSRHVHVASGVYVRRSPIPSDWISTIRIFTAGKLLSASNVLSTEYMKPAVYILSVLLYIVILLLPPSILDLWRLAGVRYVLYKPRMTCVNWKILSLTNQSQQNHK